jgi:predicted unusual protein kinase regulating ubiquinone biosynthesis (AarF/ABC1/UbiB family)
VDAVVSRNAPDGSTRLRRLRALMGISQRDLARELRVAASAVAHWEVGRHDIPGPVLRLIELFEHELGLVEARARPWELESGGRGARTATAVMSSVLWLILRPTARAGELGPLAARSRELIVERYARAIGALKGLPMKIGQMTAYMDFALPEADRATLRELLRHAPTIPPAKLGALFRAELGAHPRDLFATWEPEPFATASLGQVHRATLTSGRRVAVKVQYPGVAASLAGDLPGEMLHPLLRMIFPATPPDVLTREWRERFTEECDYQREAWAQRELARRFADRADVVIPGVVAERSTSRILTMDLLDGRDFDELERTGSQIERDRACATILAFYLRSIFREGLFDADPNPGNFVFLPDRVGFLDFGRVVELSPAFVELWRRLVRATLERDWPTLLRTWRQHLGHVEHEVPLRRQMLAFHRPFVAADLYRFNRDHLRQTYRAWSPENPNLRWVRYPREMVFFHQFYFGVYAILARLDAAVRGRSQLLNLLYAPGEARPPPFSLDELRALDLT